MVDTSNTHLKFVSASEDKNMSNGMRNISRVPLTDSEIKKILKEIDRIET